MNISDYQYSSELDDIETLVYRDIARSSNTHLLVYRASRTEYRCVVVPASTFYGTAERRTYEHRAPIKLGTMSERGLSSTRRSYIYEGIYT